ncbi:hypothetical protein LZ31DRAFT_632755 [Colletotrichum somersetense]|nr:hypothetical protein LZ31DRAFT_632755 [Colletotrichum somersetense]
MEFDDAAGELFIPAAEAAATDNPRLNLAGTFVAASAGSSITRGVNADGSHVVPSSHCGRRRRSNSLTVAGERARAWYQPSGEISRG